MDERFGHTIMETQAEVAADVLSVAAGNTDEPVKLGALPWRGCAGRRWENQQPGETIDKSGTISLHHERRKRELEDKK